MAIRSVLPAALLGLACAAAAAQPSSGATATASGASAAQAAAFRCGGVGEEDQQRMKAEAARHALMLTFATADGAYVADVDVEIRRGGQTVLQGHCGGPIMLVDLAPSGSYEVLATARGHTQRQSISIGSKPASITLRWPR